MDSKKVRRTFLRGVNGSLRLAILSAFIWHSAATTAAEQAPGVSDRQILLGGVFALTGPVRFISLPYEQGVSAVFKNTNANGGIHGRMIKWRIEDDAYQPARTLAGAKKLVERDGTFAVFGLIGQPTTMAVAPYLQKMKVPFFTLNAAPRPLTPYSWGTQSSYADLSYHVTRHMVQKLGLKRIGYLYQNDDLGAVERVGVDRALSELGVKLTSAVGYERGTRDFTTQVLKLRDAKVDGVVSIGTAGSIATAIKQGVQLNIRPTWGTYGVGGSAIVRKLLGDNINGLVFASDIESQFSGSPAAKKAFAVVQKYYPKAKSEFTMFMGYAQAQMMVHVLRAAGKDLTREKLVAALLNMGTYKSDVMPMSYSSTKHTAASAVKIYQWKDGKPVALSDWLPISGK